MAGDDTQTWIPLRLVRVVLRERADQQWIFLQEVVEDGDPSSGRGFPIVIGSGEAGELHRVVTNVRTPRPLTHQLGAALVEALGARIAGVDIVDLRQNTFYAKIRLESADGEEVEVDARPSDALALALRAGARVRVAESVLEQVRTDQNVDKLPDVSAESLEEDEHESDDADGDEPQGDEPDDSDRDDA